MIRTGIDNAKEKPGIAMDCIHIDMEKIFNQREECELAEGTLAVFSKMSQSFSIATFNVLTQTLINRAAIPFASKTDLKAKSRQPLVPKELFNLESDILCLQEVSDIHRFTQLSLI